MTFAELEQLPILQQFCEMFRRLTDLPFHLMDRDYHVSQRFVESPAENAFCRLIQCSPQGKARCRYSAQKAGIETAPYVKPYIYRCHAGMIDIAVPIISKGKFIGCLCSGKILAKKPSPREMAQLMRAWSAAGYDATKLKKTYFQANVIPRLKIEVIAKFLLFMVNYMLEAEDKISSLSQNLAQYDPILKSQEFMRAHYSEKISLAVVAQHVSLSPSRFDHVFKERTGTTFVHYLQRLRLDKVKYLLTSSDLRIAEIAMATGFFSLGHFNRAFKSQEGLAPREYRQRARY